MNVKAQCAIVKFKCKDTQFFMQFEKQYKIIVLLLFLVNDFFYIFVYSNHQSDNNWKKYAFKRVYKETSKEFHFFNYP